MWEILQKHTKISTKKEDLSNNFLKIESVIQKHADSHNFLLDLKKSYEDNWGNPLNNKYDFKKLKAFIKEDITIRYYDKNNIY